MKESTRNNPFPYTDSNKRYYSYDYYLRQRFGGKVSKIPLDLGCTCPNIDGTKGTGGCIYCSPRGSGDFAGDPGKSVPDQFYDGCRLLDGKWEGAKHIAYFQAHTNTYGDKKRLMQEIRGALDLPSVVGISVATRADCVDPEWADFFREISEKTYLCVELGLQSVHDKTAQLINRCHTFDEFVKGYEMLEGVNRAIHLINGLPGEDRQMMTESAETVGNMKPHELKIHLLHILETTRLGEEFTKGNVGVMTREEYVSTVCDQLEVIPQKTVIGRITGDGAPNDLLAPEWSRKKLVVMNEIDKELVRRNSMQGAKYKGN